MTRKKKKYTVHFKSSILYCVTEWLPQTERRRKKRCFVKSCHGDASPAGQVVVGGTDLSCFLLFSIKLPSDGSSISCPVLSLPARNSSVPVVATWSQMEADLTLCIQRRALSISPFFPLSAPSRQCSSAPKTLYKHSLTEKAETICVLFIVFWWTLMDVTQEVLKTLPEVSHYDHTWTHAEQNSRKAR